VAGTPANGATPAEMTAARLAGSKSKETLALEAQNEQLVHESADPVIRERHRLRIVLPLKVRVVIETYVNTRSRREALIEGGYIAKKVSVTWNKVMKTHGAKEYLAFLESLKLAEPDYTWCLNRLVSIAEDKKTPAAARVTAICKIGAMKDIHGLADDAPTAGIKVVAPVKVFIGIDTSKV